MPAIVMNTRKAAVAEYDWAFNSISANYATDADGLYALGGDTDNDVAITGEVRTGKPAVGARASVEDVYFGLQGTGTGVCRVENDQGSAEYGFTVRATGISRAVPGKGVTSSYLLFGYRNVDGADFRLDKIEPTIAASKTRRIG